ncbi:hypothetical protein AKJ52_02875 [candidate division MSBL1 archaeon SCGC-AAA382C18]|uniref:Uncharacterized protein n=1 Tax=candidate division MSBL1 archaeon SCGC-AAA382C18 TaxID=1698281 RepID=A0A133VHI1_9EURY|nr:hypothetical protein AKJ52_02875 [candidate division MSBL1 archaeon SCGC-AAA382C18]
MKRVSKTPQEELVGPVASEMLNFLQDGTIDPDFVGEHLEFKGIDRIQDWESILRIHFVLSDKVVEFLEKLPERVRRIKTESEKQEIRRKGEIRGRVNWKKTIIEQKSTSDESLFVSQNPSKNYDVSENLVLKKILSIIHTVIERDLEKPLEKDYNWLKKLGKDKETVNYLKNIYRKNVHINRIQDPSQYNVSDRDISIAENSRKELYKEAASLLIKYRELMEEKYDEKELEELLRETLIIPGDTPTLFELYSIFKLICKMKKDFKLIKIAGEKDGIAVFEKGEKEIIIYHDSTGKMSFHEKAKELEDAAPDNKQLERYRKSVVKHAEIIEKLLNKTDESFYGGRPDILVEYRRDGELKELDIGEVKYSENKSVFSDGLKELIQYIYFSRENEEYSLENAKVKGILVVDKKEFLDEDKLDELDSDKEIDFVSDLEILDTEMLKKYEYD